MDMPAFKQEDLVELLTALGKSTGLDFLLMDEESKVLYRMSMIKDMAIFRYRLDYKGKIMEGLEPLKEHQIMYYTDNLGLQYLASGILMEERRAGIVAGPFLANQFTEEAQKGIIEKNAIPLEDQQYLYEAVKTMRSLTQEEYFSIGKIILWLLRRKEVPLDIVYVSSEPADYERIRPKDIEEAFTLIDERYRVENRMMDLVAQGDATSAKSMFSKTVFDFSHRVPNDPLRAMKNLFLTLNTILRLTIVKTGVPPLYIHQLSDSMAILIENAQSMGKLQQMGDRLIDEYCTLVQRNKTKGLSRHIHKAVQYIETHLGEKITLNELSAVADCNESHLSRQFRKETGKTVTEWINEKRIERAKNLLEENQENITEIALLCGFEHHSYFSRRFRDVTGMTPLEYQKFHKR